MNGIRALWLRLQASLWFVPTVVVSGCVVLALVLIEAHNWVDLDFARRWPRLFGAGSDGSRSMLSAIATSMVTVAGVVFSVTIVALSLASQQYSPRVLRTFMNDRPTQTVLGVFVGIFAYCLIVLRTIRSSEDGDEGFLPSLAVFGGVVLALFGVAMLIYFIHHVASSIQASSILDRITHDTDEAIARLFPEPVGEPAPPGEWDGEDLPERWSAVASPGTGYLVGVDNEGLLGFAARHGRVVRLAQPIGDFVIEGQPLAEVSGEAPLGDEEARALCALFTLDRQRNVHQDAPYGVQQLVDVAVKALSPGINDPTTAVMCIDRLCALLVRLAGRRIPGPCRSDGQALRVVARGPGFEDMAALAFDAITAHTRGDAEVFTRLIGALDAIGRSTGDPRRLHALRERLDLVTEAAARTVDSPVRREVLMRQARALALRLGTPASGPAG